MGAKFPNFLRAEFDGEYFKPYIRISISRGRDSVEFHEEYYFNINKTANKFAGEIESSASREFPESHRLTEADSYTIVRNGFQSTNANADIQEILARIDKYMDCNLKSSQ